MKCKADRQRERERRQDKASLSPYLACNVGIVDVVVAALLCCCYDCYGGCYDGCYGGGVPNKSVCQTDKQTNTRFRLTGLDWTGRMQQCSYTK